MNTLPFPLINTPVLRLTGQRSSGQQTREQKRSAGRQLGGGDDDFDYEASLRRCSLCVRVSGLFCYRVRVRVTC